MNLLYTPYIGITDFTSFTQVEDMLAVFRAFKKPSSAICRLHVGVMMSYKTMHDLPTKWGDAFPLKESIPDIFQSMEDDVMNTLHYADYDLNDVAGNITKAVGYCGPYIDAIQLDMPWPDPGQVAHGIHSTRKPLEVILQIGERAIEEAHGDPKEIVGRIGDYEDVIHHVLLDKSMGRGVGMNAEALLPIAEAIFAEGLNLSLAAAGGLGPDSLDLVAPLLKEFPDLSIDAQSRLRPSKNALDPIDWHMAKQYLQKALAMYT